MKRILVIDDEELVLKSVTKLLRKHGYDVEATKRGAEAVAFAEAQHVDLVVCDIRMPEMNGIETIKKLRNVWASKNESPAPEILITGYAEDQANLEAEELKVSEYIYKPFDLRDFLSAVEKHLKVS